MRFCVCRGEAVWPAEREVCVSVCVLGAGVPQPAERGVCVLVCVKGGGLAAERCVCVSCLLTHAGEELTKREEEMRLES